MYIDLVLRQEHGIYKLTLLHKDNRLLSDAGTWFMNRFDVLIYKIMNSISLLPGQTEKC